MSDKKKGKRIWITDMAESIDLWTKKPVVYNSAYYDCDDNPGYLENVCRDSLSTILRRSGVHLPRAGSKQVVAFDIVPVTEK